jgi:hypothetical protein
LNVLSKQLTLLKKVMMNGNEESKYKTGALVTANASPAERLIVRRYVDRIYYCRQERDPEGQDIVYFERELTAVNHTRTAEQVWQSQQPV